jgi:hypothetical protein
MEIMLMTRYLVLASLQSFMRVPCGQREGAMLGSCLLQGSLELPIQTLCPFLHTSYPCFHALF